MTDSDAPRSPAARGPGDSSSGLLADRYHELMGFRQEAFDTYRANDISFLAGPKAGIYFPVVSLNDRGTAKKRVGPLRLYDRSPIASFVERDLRTRKSGVRILEIGPGTGQLAQSLLAQFPDRIQSYLAIERDPNVSGPYTRIASVADMQHAADVVIASEVIEHMTADELYATILGPLAQKLTPGSTFIAGTPNPLSAGGIARDFTHVQNYPWYDLYAIFRLIFGEVRIYRTNYLYDIKRLVLLLPRAILCGVMELEWCEGLVCVATRPRGVDEYI
jgi:SAM-dependent methyltransferase